MKTFRAELPGESQTPNQSALSGQIADLQRHETQVQLRTSDLQVQIAQLSRQQSTAFTKTEAMQFDKPLADLQHELTATRIDFDATRVTLEQLRAQARGNVATTTQAPAAPPLIGPSQLEKAGTGLFFLLIPIALAFARRIWIRSGASHHAHYDIESSPRLQRLEEAVDSIAVEVERIGEAQRFATKLLSERRADPLPVRATTPVPANIRREAGTITPH